jgi:hypothetical protein
MRRCRSNRLQQPVDAGSGNTELLGDCSGSHHSAEADNLSRIDIGWAA